MRLVTDFYKRNIYSKKGDTIVEVLIAITVLSMALGIGFATIGRSNAGLQANKEQFQAQQIANQQIEYLRASDAGANGGTVRNAFNGTAPNCLQMSGSVILVISVINGDNCKNKAMGGASIYTIDVACVDNLGVRGACNTAKDVMSVYSVIITWDNVKGSQSTLELQYAM
jgi:type II secretory pathway pseudopilin PulG